MKVVVAIDSLKGSLSSLEAGNAIKESINEVIPGADVEVHPLADGGEGTVEALTLGMGGTIETIPVKGPLGEKVHAGYGIIPKRQLAIIEMAAAAGITLIATEERNPLHTTTYGVGEMIKDAISKGCRHFIIGIGGSATNDGGAGMLQALGYALLDKDNQEISLGAQGLADLKSISTDKVIEELKECDFKIACDVTNPLCGAQGCSSIFGPQKGADEDMITEMDTWLSNYATLATSVSEKADATIEGTGAAGGLGFAFLAFTNATLEPGIDIILSEINIEKAISEADLVVTGEGRLDGQTVMGKAPIGVAKLAKKYGKKVVAFSGSVTEDAILCNQHGIDAFFPIVRRLISLDEAMSKEVAYKNMKETATQVFRLINLYNY
ncbi:glycerate kinase [Streptococcus agalactiae]|uniref:glycerate kinase family protein n=1 Tax=Streptococcus agalactiae TaxID=1311 RepID=UPI0002BBFEAC|nr:glycerate kinase [Streptococcus agalactiae]AIX04573.1 glycerate kinase family protein [Streptococcus agalactiae CNCTC 10/84]EPT54593.1 glycerate kinase [Streptococcus agalactiae CCUG 25532]EPT84938.1 glycerate kinase [Streptococcus agalactiae BSU247]EPV19052.1 glycerate kinase [Streptococcus agalactiae GB00640]EPW98663.1 glycerate kinase [Streptococcus agalactiae MRI Z1-048]